MPVRRPRTAHLLVAVAMAMCVAALPASRALACSCGALGTAVDGARAAIADGQLVFIGSVADAMPAGRDATFGGQLIRYAFAVEAASQPVGATVEVSALGGDGGASCGIEFAVGQRWTIAATEEAGGYTTHLCAANYVVDGLDPGDVAALRGLLTASPLVDEPGSANGIAVPVEIIVVGAGIALVGLASALAFRRRVS